MLVQEIKFTEHLNAGLSIIAGVYFECGLDFADIGIWDAAIACFSQAILLDSEYSHAYYQ